MGIREAGFTLLELIIVIIIVGILATVGLTTYTNQVEYSRAAEAKAKIGVMRKLAYEYYLKNGTTTGMSATDAGVTTTCSSDGFYYIEWWTSACGGSCRYLVAGRCTSGGKSPNASRAYRMWMLYYPATGQSDWHCQYTDDSSACLGMSS